MGSSLSRALVVGVGFCSLGLVAACTIETGAAEKPAAAAPAKTPEHASVGDAGTTTAPEAAPPPGKPEPPPPSEDMFPVAVNRGGSVVKNPKIVPITFANDPLVKPIEAFTGKLAGSEYWTAISSEYGVGAVTMQTPIHVNETPPASISDTQIRAWLAQKFETDARFGGTPQADTVYAIHYPANVSISYSGSTSCDFFGGYHEETVVKGVAVPYVVLPRCASFNELTGIDTVTYAASHEYLEWATDPFPESVPAWASVDPEHFIWGFAFLPELGDLCVSGIDNTVRPAELGGVVVQRTWSNKAAKAGHHPCVPYPTKTPYFTAIPMLPDATAMTDPFTQEEVQTHGLRVGVGETKNIQVRLYADGPMTEWKVQVLDLAKLNGLDPEFDVALDKDHGVNGDMLTLTVTGIAPASSGFGFLLVSRGADTVNVWPGLLFN